MVYNPFQSEFGGRKNGKGGERLGLWGCLNLFSQNHPPPPFPAFIALLPQLKVQFLITTFYCAGGVKFVDENVIAHNKGRERVELRFSGYQTAELSTVKAEGIMRGETSTKWTSVLSPPTETRRTMPDFGQVFPIVSSFNYSRHCGAIKCDERLPSSISVWSASP